MRYRAVFLGLLAGLALSAAMAGARQAAAPAFNVRDFGATGMKSQNAKEAIQAAIDACGRAGGGLVYVPPGEYSTGTLHLRSRVRFFVEAGATIYSIKDKSAFDRDALFYGEDLENITLEGRGVIDGQGRYEWRETGDFHDDFIYPNQLEMIKAGRPLLRSFPRQDQFGKLVLLVRCRDVRIAGLSFVDSPSWTIHPYGCERLIIDGVHIRSSLKEGVWADGIDPDGCRDVRISNSTIETGDDAIVFYSMNWFGPALPCENITVTNCRLSSASSALKFCDGNMNSVRRVTVSNCVITDSNRGLAFMVFDGGVVEDVVISSLTIECRRHDWFWWGDGDPIHFNIKKRSEVHRGWKKEDDRPAGVIRNVLIRDVVARGMGTCGLNGHPESPLRGVTIENLKLFISHDADAPYDKTEHAMDIRLAENLKLRNVEVFWGEPAYERWAAAINFKDVQGLELEDVNAAPARRGDRTAAALIFDDVRDAVVRECRALPGTGVFLSFLGAKTGNILLSGNIHRDASVYYTQRKEVKRGAVVAVGDD
jgi:hypothetical protein